jgi:hypothetical protein
MHWVFGRTNFTADAKHTVQRTLGKLQTKNEEANELAARKKRKGILSYGF